MRLGEAYRDADNDEILGYEAVLVSTALLASSADPAVFEVIEDFREVKADDLLIPVSGDPFDKDVYPVRAPAQLEASVLAIFDLKSLAGLYDVITIDSGKSDGVDVGHVISLERKLTELYDRRTNQRVPLPDEQLAYALVFDSEPRYAHAIILNGKLEVKKGDAVRAPK